MEDEIQPVGVAMSAPVVTALQAGVPVSASQQGQSLAGYHSASGRPRSGPFGEGWQHLEQSPPGEIGTTTPRREMRIAGLMQIGVERLRLRGGSVVELPQPAPELAILTRGTPDSRQADLPELEVHRLRQ
jgi:hypothetical protein